MSNREAALVAGDWGTSHLRLWLLDRNGDIVAERRSADGVLAAQQKGFERVLEDHLAALGAPADLPAIVCGMVGSRQGWAEARYVDAPARLDALAAEAVAAPAAGRDVRILPGIAQRDAAAPEVMRGEETQLAGALGPETAGALVCMPGSHSKWVRVADNAVASFATFMSGELYAAIGRHTILSQAVEDLAFDAEGNAAFADAVTAMLDEPAAFSRALFAIRAGQLLGHGDKRDGAARLSGTLIGAELAGARHLWSAERSVLLIASGALAAPYRVAIGIAGCAVAEIDAEAAARRGLFRAALSLWPTLKTMEAG